MPNIFIHINSILQASSRSMTTTVSSFVFSAPAVAVVTTSPILGNLVPATGVKFMFVSGLFTLGACNVLFGLLDYMAESFFIIFSFLIRLMEGIGTAAFLTSHFTTIIQYFPNHISFVFGLTEMSSGVGMALGPAIGGFIYHFGGFQLPFYILGAAVLLLIPFSMFSLPPSPIEVSTIKYSSMLKLMKVVDVVVLLLIVIVSLVNWTFIDPTLAPFLQQFNFTILQVSLVFMLAAVMYATLSPIWGWIIDKVGFPYAFMNIGFLGAAVSMMLLGPTPLLPFIPTKLWIVLLSLVLYGVSVSVCIIPTFDELNNATSQAGLPNNLSTYGIVAGMWSSASSFGEVLGPMAGGALVGKFGFPVASTALALLDLSMIVVVLIFCHWRKVRRKNQESDLEVVTEIDQRENPSDKEPLV